jgi:hypothetical protein
MPSKFGLESKLGQVWLDFCNGLYYDYIGIVSVFFKLHDQVIGTAYLDKTSSSKKYAQKRRLVDFFK